MAERQLPKLDVAGSSPVSRSIFAFIAELDSRAGYPIVFEQAGCPSGGKEENGSSRHALNANSGRCRCPVGR